MLSPSATLLVSAVTQITAIQIVVLTLDIAILLKSAGSRRAFITLLRFPPGKQLGACRIDMPCELLLCLRSAKGAEDTDMMLF